MDFSTTEAADDLGGLARTITESVALQSPAGARRARGRFDRDLWGS
jgi:hypothetical protein